MNNQDIKILYIEDEPIMMKFLELSLGRKGYNNIKYVNNGAEALKLLKNENFDIILSDMHLPDMTGMDIYFKLTKPTPIIFITADDKSCYYGVLDKNFINNNFVIKPVDYEELNKKIQNLFY